MKMLEEEIILNEDNIVDILTYLNGFPQNQRIRKKAYDQEFINKFITKYDLPTQYMVKIPTNNIFKMFTGQKVSCRVYFTEYHNYKITWIDRPKFNYEGCLYFPYSSNMKSNGFKCLIKYYY